jgi:dephospho-CoA kinase
MKVALTGGIACGKSLLSQFLNELGVETLDADDVVHALLPDPEERRRIAAEVFSDPEKRRELEAKIHPLVKERIDTWLSLSQDGFNAETQRRVTAAQAGLAICSEPSRAKRVPREAESPSDLCVKKTGIKIAIIPLLFEAHWEKNFDIICCVVSSREKQIERMTTTRGMTCAEAEARLAAQLPVEEKAKRSHYVIRNDGTAEELKAQAVAFLKFVTQKQMQPKPPDD